MSDVIFKNKNNSESSNLHVIVIQGEILTTKPQVAVLRMQKKKHNIGLCIYNSCIHPCIHLRIHPSIHPFSHPFIHSFIHSSIHLPIHPSTYPFIYPSLRSFTHLFIHPFTIPSNSQSILENNTSFCKETCRCTAYLVKPQCEWVPIRH